MELRLPSRAWKVKLHGEAADDAGGVFDETMTQMCDELMSGVLKVLIRTPNHAADVGQFRDSYVLNPSAESQVDLDLFK